MRNARVYFSAARSRADLLYPLGPLNIRMRLAGSAVRRRRTAGHSRFVRLARPCLNDARCDGHAGSAAEPWAGLGAVAGVAGCPCARRFTVASGVPPGGLPTM